MKHIDTESFSEHLRSKAIDIENKTVLITNYSGSLQEQDLTEPANCNGFGRVRHFRLKGKESWPTNPLPIIPAAKALNHEITSDLRAQVFQNAVCNWRCWYCFVDFNLLSGNKKYSEYLSCDELLDLYENEQNRPLVIDLTGGQPDLTPEWVPWMMQSLIDRGLDAKTFLWSDDNLSNDYFWQYLTHSQIELIQSYKMYARVCCFKGIDDNSFSLNTKAHPSLFDNQFHLFERIHNLHIDLYGYITLTAPTQTNFGDAIARFMDRIQKINENMPLRIVPLEVFKFKPVIGRIDDITEDLLQGQYLAIDFWMKELQSRFDRDLLEALITDIKV